MGGRAIEIKCAEHCWIPDLQYEIRNPIFPTLSRLSLSKATFRLPTSIFCHLTSARRRVARRAKTGHLPSVLWRLFSDLWLLSSDLCLLSSVLCLLSSDICVPRRSSESADGSPDFCSLTSVFCHLTSVICPLTSVFYCPQQPKAY